MSGPPVARIRSTSFIKRFVFGSDGASIQPMMSAGAPAATAASKTIFAAAIVAFLARGCGEMMIALRVFKQMRVLKIAVDVGFVVGMTAAIRPIGSAIFLMP